MTKTQVEVITSVQRRWRWSRAEKERIVAAALEREVVASKVARSRDTHESAVSVAATALQADPGARRVQFCDRIAETSGSRLWIDFELRTCCRRRWSDEANGGIVEGSYASVAIVSGRGMVNGLA
jgi:hypothetical protein